MKDRGASKIKSLSKLFFEESKEKIVYNRKLYVE
jgi:hypothetical protein